MIDLADLRAAEGVIQALAEIDRRSDVRSAEACLARLVETDQRVSKRLAARSPR